MSYKTFIYWMRSQLDDLYGWAANPGPVVQSLNFVVVQSLSCVSLFVTPWAAVCQASLSFTLSQSLLSFMFTELVLQPNNLILCCPLLLPSIFPSMRIFSNESALCIRWPKYWSFRFSISPSSEYSGLISFRTDWFDFLAVQGTLKSLLQHHSPKASIPQCSSFFMIQLSHPLLSLLIKKKKKSFVPPPCTDLKSLEFRLLSCTFLDSPSDCDAHSFLETLRSYPIIRFSDYNTLIRIQFTIPRE